MSPFSEPGLRLSAWGKLSAAKGSRRVTARSFGPGFLLTQAGALPGPLTATLPALGRNVNPALARVPSPPELFTGLPATPPHWWVSVPAPMRPQLNLLSRELSGLCTPPACSCRRRPRPPPRAPKGETRSGAAQKRCGGGSDGAARRCAWRLPLSEASTPTPRPPQTPPHPTTLPPSTQPSRTAPLRSYVPRTTSPRGMRVAEMERRKKRAE